MWGNMGRVRATWNVPSASSASRRGALYRSTPPTTRRSTRASPVPTCPRPRLKQSNIIDGIKVSHTNVNTVTKFLPNGRRTSATCASSTRPSSYAASAGTPS
ncbi:hypothetical protein JYU34_015978 [Plutella xylostella]|uniref:Uncharacterized protein n=1 Tax=Plutella xylostella TaxID=51655 RepID=A0ABQ7Q676_PLUXY|nr:hypothetical protein JYU34_015978 [Plutella xylostella]